MDMEAIALPQVRVSEKGWEGVKVADGIQIRIFTHYCKYKYNYSYKM